MNSGCRRHRTPWTGFDSLRNQLERAVLSKHIGCDEFCRQAQLGLQGFALSTLGAVDDEDITLLETLNSRLEEIFGGREREGERGPRAGSAGRGAAGCGCHEGVGTMLSGVTSFSPAEKLAHQEVS